MNIPFKGEDVFVAKFSAYQQAAGEFVSFSTWSEMVPTFLPVSEFVALVKSENGEPANALGLARWQQLVDVCGHHLYKADGYPARYYVNSFPTAAEIDRLELTDL